MTGAVLAALVAAGTAQAEKTSALSVSVGCGLAYELLGVQIGYRSGHVEGYLATGPIVSVLPGIGFGARYHFAEGGSGPFIALNLAWHSGTVRTGDVGPNDYDPTGGRLLWATFTPGFRAGSGPFFFQAAFGFGVAWSKTFYRAPQFPIGPPPTPHTFTVIPDLLLGIGVSL